MDTEKDIENKSEIEWPVEMNDERASGLDAFGTSLDDEDAMPGLDIF
jgi:hypothetical protein